MGLMTHLLNEGMLEDDDGNAIPKLLWHKDEAVRKAAREFVYLDTFAEEEEQSDKEQDLVQLLNIYQMCSPAVQAAEPGKEDAEYALLSCCYA